MSGSTPCWPRPWWSASGRRWPRATPGGQAPMPRGPAPRARPPPPAPRREIVVSHAAFGYLAARYRLSMVPVMGLAPESEPSPAQLASIVRFARQKKVKYIFFETLVSPRLAETLARGG